MQAKQLARNQTPQTLLAQQHPKCRVPMGNIITKRHEN